MNEEMMKALQADGEKLRQLTGEDHGPQFWENCPECDGEGSIEKWESVSKWSIDPPSAYVVPCQACGGAGGFLCEVEADL